MPVSPWLVISHPSEALDCICGRSHHVASWLLIFCHYYWAWSRACQHHRLTARGGCRIKSQKFLSSSGKLIGGTGEGSRQGDSLYATSSAYGPQSRSQAGTESPQLLFDILNQHKFVYIKIVSAFTPSNESPYVKATTTLLLQSSCYQISLVPTPFFLGREMGQPHPIHFSHSTLGVSC